MNKKNVSILGAIALTAIVSIGGAYAAETIGTVTGRDGDTQDLVRVQAQVTSVDGSEVTFVDQQDGTEYSAGFGPSWYSQEYAAGEQITVEGVATDGDNEQDHTFQAMKVNDTVLREEFEGRPAWAGSRGQGMSEGTGSHGTGRGGRGSMGGSGTGDCQYDTAI